MPTPTEALTSVASPRAAGGTPTAAPTLTPTSPAATATRPTAAVATAVPPAPTSTRPPFTETPRPAATATVQPSPPPSVAPSGQVVVLTDKRTYGVGEAVTVTIVNRLSVPVYGQTGQSYCSIVAVLRDVDGQWQVQARCVAAGGPPGAVAIEPGAQLAVELVPRYPSDPTLAPGQYVIEFVYREGSPSGPDRYVRSLEFRVEA